MMQLLLGCGHNPQKQMGGTKDWENLVTLDINPLAKPDYIWDLNNLPLPFKDNQFDEVHAYHVLEHFGRQGDFKAFFDFFSELWRVMKPGAFFFGIVPSIMDQIWIWGDPGHTRTINQGTLAFLCQKNYVESIGITHMTDYRWCYKADFNIHDCFVGPEELRWVMEAVK